MHAHTQAGNRDSKRPDTANGHEQLFLIVQTAVERRQEDQQHGAGGAGRVAGWERAELVRCNAVSDKLFLERCTGLPPI